MPPNLQKLYLHSHIDFMYCIDSIDSGVEHTLWWDGIVHGGEAHLQQVDHLGHVTTHGTELIKEPVPITRCQITETITSSYVQEEGERKRGGGRGEREKMRERERRAAIYDTPILIFFNYIMPIKICNLNFFYLEQSAPWKAIVYSEGKVQQWWSKQEKGVHCQGCLDKTAVAVSLRPSQRSRTWLGPWWTLTWNAQQAAKLWDIQT